MARATLCLARGLQTSSFTLATPWTQRHLPFPQFCGPALSIYPWMYSELKGWLPASRSPRRSGFENPVPCTFPTLPPSLPRHQL